MPNSVDPFQDNTIQGVLGYLPPPHRPHGEDNIVTNL